jgi:hypothetical protein
LCRRIVAEKDPQKADDLLSLLQAVIRDDQEEIRTRLAFLAKKYPIAPDHSNSDEPSLDELRLDQSKLAS